MKSFLITILTIISVTVYGQQYTRTVNEITNKSVIKVLGRINNFFTKQSDQFGISFFIVSNDSGSANIPEGHESTRNVVISVADFDENPGNRVFNVGPFYMPKLFDGRNLKDRYIIIVEHGAADNRKKTKLIIYLDKVIVE